MTSLPRFVSYLVSVWTRPHLVMLSCFVVNLMVATAPRRMAMQRIREGLTGAPFTKTGDRSNGRCSADWIYV